MLKLETYHSIYSNEVFLNKRKTPSVLWFISRLFDRRTLYNDRFNIITKDDIEWHSLDLNDDINSIYQANVKSMEEMCYDRVNEIICYADAHDIPNIYISWSGGIDSTLIVISFLSHDNFDKKRLHILHNDSSIKEYSWMYRYFLDNGIATHNFYNDYAIYETIAGNNIIINGHGGDYIFPANLFSVQHNFNNWKDGIIHFCNSYGFSNYEYYIENLKNTIQKFPLDIQTFPEMGWLLCFDTLWHRNMYFKKVISDYPERRMSFYDTLYFQKYALSGFYNIRKGVHADGIMYKAKMKNIIKNYTKDNEYCYKGKNYSNIFSVKNSMHDSIICIKDNNGYKKEKSGIQYLIDNYFIDDYKNYISTQEIKGIKQYEIY